MLLTAEYKLQRDGGRGGELGDRGVRRGCTIDATALRHLRRHVGDQ